METTLILLKPSAVERGIVGEVISRFENKGIQIVGMKMMQLTDSILDEHYAHLKDKPFFARIKASMKSCPIVAMALRGVGVIDVVRKMAGVTNGREAEPGTIRGDYSMSIQENVIHASDSLETAEIEVKRFFSDDELFDYPQYLNPYIYALNEK